MFKTNRKFYLLDKTNVIFFIVLIFLFIGIFQFQSFKEFIAKYENVLIDFRFKQESNIYEEIRRQVTFVQPKLYWQ